MTERVRRLYIVPDPAPPPLWVPAPEPSVWQAAVAQLRGIFLALIGRPPRDG
ncbi:hypothetical protein NONO_c60350 [Nocardia nova SH22a]|uniref:Transposase n=1 Tax=Nocardia nova SH22a TaxID=1415166 RepID=W5TUD6_9NOCA|nr:hypothetical protein [Nocardia nova]AHH20811.1 hypothetical protein NONO_c60350 [Nocardia nova SH22a]